MDKTKSAIEQYYVVMSGGGGAQEGMRWEKQDKRKLYHDGDKRETRVRFVHYIYRGRVFDFSADLIGRVLLSWERWCDNFRCGREN